MRHLQFLYLQLNRGCNYKCTHCDFWKLSEPPNALKDKDYLDILDDYDDLISWQDFLYKGNVVTCGGEPMLALGRYFKVANLCDDFSLNMMSVTNGSLIKESRMARRVIEHGPHEITISLDGPNAEIHDRMRGVPGSFEQATRAIKLLVQERYTCRADAKKIYAMALVCQSIVGRLDVFYDLVLNDLKADKLKLNIIQPTFGAPASAMDMFFGSEMIQDPDALIEEIKACDLKYKIDRNPQWLLDVRMYLQSLLDGKQVYKGWNSTHQTPEHICDTYERNVMIDVFGNMRLCFSEAFPSVQWKKKGDLKRFWESTSLPIAERMKCCNRYCGISHSVRKEPSTISGRLKKFLPVVPY